MVVFTELPTITQVGKQLGLNGNPYSSAISHHGRILIDQYDPNQFDHNDIIIPHYKTERHFSLYKYSFGSFNYQWTQTGSRTTDPYHKIYRESDTGDELMLVYYSCNCAFVSLVSNLQVGAWENLGFCGIAALTDGTLVGVRPWEQGGMAVFARNSTELFGLADPPGMSDISP